MRPTRQTTPRSLCLIILVACALITLEGAAGAAAQPAVASEVPPPSPAPAPPPRLHVDIEIDPTAYVLSGYSLHAGIAWGRIRLDLGAFAIAVPSAFLPNDDFDVSFNGYGAKLQAFPFAEQWGGFFGVNATLAWQLAQRAGSDLAARDRQVSLGINAGWRFALGDHLYVTPWVSVSRNFGTGNVTLGGSTYEPKQITVFPAIHVGYLFQ